MKRFIVLSVFLTILLIPSFCIAADNPTDQGAYSLAGSISYNHHSFDSSSKTSDFFTFNPSITYFVIPNVALGLEAVYSHSNTDYGHYDNYGGGPIIRLYAPVSWEVKPFFDASYVYAKGENEAKDNMSRSEGTQELLTLSVGFDYFLSRNVALETTAAYGFVSQDTKYTNSVSGTHSLDTDDEVFNLRLGINVFIY